MHGFDRNEAGKMFVGGLSWDTTKDSLLGYFSQFGEVIDCVVMKNAETGKSRGFGFVTYRDPHCVETVLSAHVHVVDGRQVDPKACNPKGPNRGGGGGGGMGGGGPSPGPGGMMGGGFPGEPPHRMNRGPQGDIKDRKIFVGGLPNNADEESIKKFFSQYGKVQDVTIMYDPQKQRSRGFGFLTFENEEAVNKVCHEHFVTFNGKKVECKMATPRDRRGPEGLPPPPPPMGHMGQEEPQPLTPGPPGPPPPSHLPPLEMGGQPPQGPPFQMQEQNWAPPPETTWNPPPSQGPPPPMGAPPQFPQGVQFQGYQSDQPPPMQPQQGGWPQPPPPAPTGAWAPGAVPPPNQPQPQAAVSAPFMSQSPVTQTFSSAPAYQQTAGGAIYQWAASPPGQQPPPAPNGQPPSSALGQPPQTGYSYSTQAYGSHPVVTSSPTPGLPARSYQDFSNGQAQIPTSIAPVQPPAGPPPPVSTPQTFASYTSPYAAPAPQQVASAPPTDPYGQAGVPAPPPQGAIQVAAPSTPGQPASLQGTVQGYGNAIGQSPLTSNPDPSAASKAAVDYSSYYSAYGNLGPQYQAENAAGYTVGGNATPHMASAVPGALPQGGASYSTQSQVPTSAVTGYGAEATQNAAAAAYGAQPAPAPAPSAYGGQGEAQQAVAYGAPGPAPSFQRQGSATQSYHPYARR